MNGQQVKQRLWRQGSTLKEWAEKNGYSARLVSDVVRGVNRGTYGKGHEIAVKLGMRKGEEDNQ
jgi:gp16 family phage-associated protein